MKQHSIDVETEQHRRRLVASWQALLL